MSLPGIHPLQVNQMKNGPNNKKEKSPIKVSNTALSCEIHLEHGEIAEFTEEKMIFDLLGSPMSPNQVQRHMENVFKVHRKTHKIRQVLLRKKGRIQAINGKFDFIAFRILSLLEIDETFKGRKISLLVVIDTLTGYIFHFQWLKSRSKKGILDALVSKRELFYDTILVLTDGAPYFPEVVKELCPFAKHQTCLIHVMRNLYPHLRPLQSRFKKSQATLKAARRKLRKQEHHLEDARYNLKKQKQRESYAFQKRENMHTRFNIRKYQKNILIQYPELKEINYKINIIQSYRRAAEKSVITHILKKDQYKFVIIQQEEKKNQDWGVYMRELRLLYRFYNLFHLHNKKYSQQKQKLLDSLPQFMDTDCLLAKNIKRVLTSIKNLDTVNKENSPVRLSRNFINTNVVESANSKIRPYLDLLRKIGNTEYCRTYFDLIRLKLNTSRPFSGIRNKTSPIERCGYKLRGRTWLDLIVDGLPPGSQSDIFLPKLNWELASPQRIGKCTIQTLS
jgi:transposase-like protein